MRDYQTILEDIIARKKDLSETRDDVETKNLHNELDELITEMCLVHMNPPTVLETILDIINSKESWDSSTLTKEIAYCLAKQSYI